MSREKPPFRSPPLAVTPRLSRQLRSSWRAAHRSQRTPKWTNQSLFLRAIRRYLISLHSGPAYLSGPLSYAASSYLSGIFIDTLGFEMTQFVRNTSQQGLKIPEPCYDGSQYRSDLGMGRYGHYVGHFSASLRSSSIALTRLLTLLRLIRSAQPWRKSQIEPSPHEEAKGHNEQRLHAAGVRGYFRTTICTVPAPLQNRQRSPSMSFPEPEHSRHLAIIWNSTLLVSGTLPGVSFTTSAW